MLRSSHPISNSIARNWKNRIKWEGKNVPLGRGSGTGGTGENRAVGYAGISIAGDKRAGSVAGDDWFDFFILLYANKREG